MASSAQTRAAKTAQLRKDAEAAAQTDPRRPEPETKGRPVTTVADATGHTSTGSNAGATKPQTRRQPAPAPAPATPAAAPAPAAKKFPKVKFSTRVEALAKWLSEQTKPVTGEEIAAANAPSPMSATVLAYTMPSAELVNALKALGLKLTGPTDGKYATEKLEAPKPTAPKPRAPRAGAAKAPAK